MPERKETMEVSPAVVPADCLEGVFRLWWREGNLGGAAVGMVVGLSPGGLSLQSRVLEGREPLFERH